MKTTHVAEFYVGKNKEHRWRICARNGRVVADSGEGYRRAIDCHNAFHRLIAGARDFTITIKDFRVKTEQRTRT